MQPVATIAETECRCTSAYLVFANECQPLPLQHVLRPLKGPKPQGPFPASVPQVILSSLCTSSFIHSPLGELANVSECNGHVFRNTRTFLSSSIPRLNKKKNIIAACNWSMFCVMLLTSHRVSPPTLCPDLSSPHGSSANAVISSPEPHHPWKIKSLKCVVIFDFKLCTGILHVP